MLPSVGHTEIETEPGTADPKSTRHNPMLEWLKTSSGAYNLQFIIAIIAWLIGGAALIAGFHLNKVKTIEAEAKTKRAEAERTEMAAQLETAKVKTAELEHRLAPRQLTDEQRAKLIQALAAIPKGEVYFVHVTLQPETVLFLRQVQSAFIAAGFSTPEKPEYNLSYSIAAPAPWFIGIIVGTGEPPATAVAIQHAFQQTGIDAVGVVAEEAIAKPGTFKIYVGSK